MDAQNVAGEALEAAQHASSGIVDEVKKLGSAFIAQIIGSSPNADLKHHEVKDLAKADDEFSDVAHAETAARIKAYYDEYYALKKKKQEEMEAAREQKEEEEKKLEELNETRVKENFISPEVAKTRAEIKNYGAE